MVRIFLDLTISFDLKQGQTKARSGEPVTLQITVTGLSTEFGFGLWKYEGVAKI